jgi:hypothetical protein
MNDERVKVSKKSNRPMKVRERMDINIKEIDLKQKEGRDIKEEQDLPLIR